MTQIRQLLTQLPPRLSVHELGDALGVSSQTVYRWLRGGEIPAYRVGTSWLILRDEVCDSLEARHNQP